jgi:hypothetical protein
VILPPGLNVFRACAKLMTYVTDFPVVNVHVDELSSARNWQQKLCATLSASVNIITVFQSKIHQHVHLRRESQSHNTFMTGKSVVLMEHP